MIAKGGVSVNFFSCFHLLTIPYHDLSSFDESFHAALIRLYASSFVAGG